MSWMDRIRAVFRRGRPPRPPRRVCSVRCRRSTAPAQTCTCVCGGARHGSEQPVPPLFSAIALAKEE